MLLLLDSIILSAIVLKYSVKLIKSRAYKSPQFMKSAMKSRHCLLILKLLWKHNISASLAKASEVI